MTMSITFTGLEPLRIGALRRTLLARSLSKTARRAIAAFVAWRAFRRAESELMALDDHALKDIGLHRSEIGSALMDYAQERRNGVRQGEPMSIGGLRAIRLWSKTTPQRLRQPSRCLEQAPQLQVERSFKIAS
jgi:uncharacterized protein YjiS (DUF1127 family)